GHPRAVRPPALRRGGADHLPRRAVARRRRRHPLLAGAGAGDRLGKGRRQPGDAQLRPGRVQPHAEGRNPATTRGAWMITAPPPPTPPGRLRGLGTAFAGWLCAGLPLGTPSLAMQPAAIDLLGRTGRLDRERYEDALARKAQKEELPAGEQQFL